MEVWCAHVAWWQQCGWGRCVVKERRRLPQPAGYGPNILAAHTPAVSAATPPPGEQRESAAGAVRGAWPPPCRAARSPVVCGGLRSLRRHGAGAGAGFCSGRWWGPAGSSCTGSGHGRHLASALTATRAWRAQAEERQVPPPFCQNRCFCRVHLGRGGADGAPEISSSGPGGPSLP